MDVDPAYEYEAPMFVDFTAPPQDDTGVDLWFGMSGRPLRSLSVPSLPC